MKRTLIASAIACLSLNASAADFFSGSPAWDFVEVGYVKASIDNIEEVEPAGFSVAGSKLIAENIFLAASYGTLSDDYRGLDLDLDQASVGLGYRYRATKTMDLFAAVSYEYAEVSASYQGESDSEDDNGYGLRVGVRSMIIDQLELAGTIGYVDIADESETTLGVNANFYITPSFAIGASYAVADDVDTMGILARYNF